MYKIAETDEYQALTYFFYENGLEITPGAEKSEHVIKCWECRNPVNSLLQISPWMLSTETKTLGLV